MTDLRKRVEDLESAALGLARLEFGGPGSGAQPDHPFEGNQWTGGGGKTESAPAPKKKGFFGKLADKYKAASTAEAYNKRHPDRAPGYHTPEAKAARKTARDAEWQRVADIQILPADVRARIHAGQMTDAEVKAAADARRKEMGG